MQTYKTILFRYKNIVSVLCSQSYYFAFTRPDVWILDPFAGSSTTGIAANLLDRKYLGVDIEKEFLELGKRRRKELDNPQIFKNYEERIMPKILRI